MFIYLGGKKDWMFFSYCKHDPSFWTKSSRLLAYWMICLLLLTNPRVPVRRSTNGILLLRLITRGMVGISPFVQLITRPAKWFSIFNKNKPQSQGRSRYLGNFVVAGGQNYTYLANFATFKLQNLEGGLARLGNSFFSSHVNDVSNLPGRLGRY